jgi:uncharacterized protein YjbJ (UPF0337 family)
LLDRDFTQAESIEHARIVRRIAVISSALHGHISSVLTDDERAWLATQGVPIDIYVTYSADTCCALHNRIQAQAPQANGLGSYSFTTKEAQMANKLLMANKLEEFQELGKTQLEAATTSSSAFIKNFKTIAEEATAYSEKSLAKVSTFLEELRSAKSFESAVHIHSEYTKTFFVDFAEYLMKIGEVYSNLSKEAVKPIEAVVAKVQSGKNWDGIESNWKQFAGKIKEKWGKLTDDDLAQINGKREKLEGKLQELYGHGNEQAKKEIDDLLGRLK